MEETLLRRPAATPRTVEPEPEPPPLDPAPLDDPGARPSTEAVDDGDESSSDRGDEPVQRNPPRDWAAPPPWLASSEGRRPLDDAAAPSFLGRRSEPGAGLAGSPADQMAGGAPPIRRTEQVEELWGTAATGAAVAGVAAGAAAGSPAAGSAHPAVPDEYASVEGAPGRVSRRPRAYDQHLGGPDGPDWERPRRSEAYPTIKTRVGMPEVPRIAIMAVAVGILAIALLLLPGFLNLGGGGGSTPGATASPSGTVRESFAPTEPPAPSPTVYTIKKGDTLLKVAKAHGLTLDELLAANPAIKNPNKVSEGQQIVIPVPSESPSAVAKPSAARSGGSAAP